VSYYNTKIFYCYCIPVCSVAYVMLFLCIFTLLARCSVASVVELLITHLVLIMLMCNLLSFLCSIVCFELLFLLLSLFVFKKFVGPLSQPSA
jgi:hypothetical protein